MSFEIVQRVADEAVFQPTLKVSALLNSHVPFEQLTGESFERRCLEHLTGPEAATAVLTGVSGAGKSSVVAWVANELPDESLAIRLPVSSMADVSDTGEVLKLLLSTILAVCNLPRDAQQEIAAERADTQTTARAPKGLTGVKLGGGQIPLEASVETGSLREEFTSESLNGEWLLGCKTAIEILGGLERRLIVVMEDTEAIVGSDVETVDGFFSGPVTTMAQELDISLLIAVQPDLVEQSAAYDRLAAASLAVEVPRLGDRVEEGLDRILQHRLERHGLAGQGTHCYREDALEGLADFYGEVRGDLRKTLAAAHAAGVDAAAGGSELITRAHVRVGQEQAR